jgi:calcium-dependent protein kinase
MYRTYAHKSSQIIEMEYFDRGDLFDYMKSRKILDEYNCAGVIKSVASALTYLHSLNIVHRDIKVGYFYITL